MTLLKLTEAQSILAYAIWVNQVIKWACKTYDHLDGLIEDTDSFEYDVVKKILEDFPK